MTWSAPVDRRAFLAGALKGGAGLGLAAGLGASGAAVPLLDPSGAQAAGTAGSATPTATPAAATGTGTGTAVLVEPPVPRSASHFVTRPDLTPVGVSVRSSAQRAPWWGASKYIFCAPKSPHFASPPGSGAPPQAVFPPGATPGLMIFDSRGNLVWFKPLPGPTQIPFNFHVQHYQGRDVLAWFQGRVTEAHGKGHYVLADNTYTPIATIHSTRYPCDLHELVLTPDGTALHTAYESRPRPGAVPMLIGHAQEVDIATNRLLFDWPCYPAVPTSMTYIKRNLPFFDYFHINSIGRWPGAAHNLLISARNTSAVYLVSRQTGKILWTLGGKRSDFVFGPQARFWWQHDARALADGSGISVFDDASDPSPEAFASGKVLTLDQRGRTASLQQRFIHTDGRFVTPSQGNLQLLPDGSHFVGWGFYPFFSGYAASTARTPPLIFDGRFPPGVASYRAYLSDWTGNPPLSELRLVVQRTGAAGRVRVYVSWNGATEVARWQLDAGRQAHSLAPVARFAKGSFETSAELDVGGARYFQIVARDSSGSIIGRGSVVTAS